MNQLAINYEPRDTERETVLDVVACCPDLFRFDFHQWLKLNWEIWKEFEKRSRDIWGVRKHFGHRTIWEAIRYETALREANSEFKLNDHYTKSCAQLFILLNPRCDGLFEFRERK